jgi:hypothetical protein
MIFDLMKEKNKIIQEHDQLRQKNAEKYISALEIKRKAVADNKKGAGLSLSLSEQIKATFKLDSENLLNMSGAERLQYGEQWSRDAKNLLDYLKDDPGFTSQLKDYEQMIQIWQDDLKKINEEITTAEATDKRLTELKKERKYAIKK